MKIVIAGALGRMGQTLLRQTLDAPDLTLIGGTVPEDDASHGQEIRALLPDAPAGLPLTADFGAMLGEADAIIDFTSPAYSMTLAERVAQAGKIHIIGTTGFSELQHAALRGAGGRARLVVAANMSVGVNLLAALVEQAAFLLAAEECDIEIDEMHHRFKQDAPSGTALLLGSAAAAGRKARSEAAPFLYPHPARGSRPAGAIGFSVRRGGDVVGDHSVTFASVGERLELSHKASDRTVFARGALRAARWAATQPPGFYTMRDVLGFGRGV